MAFPVSPTNGQQSTIANIVYQYASATNAWTVVPGYANVIQATGNITAGNLLTGGLISATGNITSSANISGTYLLGNVFYATGISANKIYSGTSEVAIGTSSGNANISIGGTSNVAVFATTGQYVNGVISATGNVSGGNLTTAGNVTGSYLLGNVFFATGITASKIYNGTSEVNVGTSGGPANISIGGTSNVAVFSSTGVAITGDLSVTGNATLSGNILGDRIQNGTTNIDIQTASGNANISVGGTSNVAVFATTGQYITGLISASGNITTTANISGGNILGNGRNLSGINTFSTISVSGQSDVVADSIIDTLTLAAGTGISITTDAGNDTITISSVATDSIFATGGDMGTITEVVTSSEDLGTVTSAVTISYDLGTESTGGIVTPSLLLLPSYTVAGLASVSAAPAGQFVFCSNESGGSVPAFSDGTNWRRVTDRAVVS